MKNQRQSDIMKLLTIKRSLKTEQLVQQFKVSIETIRRDMVELEQLGMIKKVYGGIQIASDELLVSDLQSWNNRMDACREEKMLIAHRALELIPDHSTIALDIGTTTHALAHLLSAKHDLTIITSSIRIAGELSRCSDHCVYVVGGILHKGEQVTMGALARDFLNNFSSLDFFFGSADGVSLDNGVTEFSEAVADVKRQLIAIAGCTVILADHSKFGKKAFFKSCPISNIHRLITDTQTPVKYLDGMKRAGVEIIVAEG